MKVLLATPRGPCAGVDRAVETVERALQEHGAPVYVRKQIVHNKHVVEELSALGAVFVDEAAEVPEGELLVFSAHGVAPAVRAQATARELRTIDATCPLVTKVHVEARRFAAEGYTIVMIGHAGHEEVEGTTGEAPEAIVLIESAAAVEALEVPDPDKVAFITQTTLSVDETAEVIAALRAKFPAIRSSKSEDICYATTNRQVAAKALAEKCELVLVIGSANSSNSNRLVEVAREHGAASYLIDDHAGVREEWLEGVETVGITSGASAPEVLVEELVEWLHGRGPVEMEESGAVQEDVRFMLPKEIREYSGRPVSESNSIRATFSVPYDYEVLFTSDALDPENLVLRDALAGPRARVLPVLDAGLVEHHPDLPDAFVAYAAAHADRIDLAAQPILLPGGEEGKEDPRHVQTVLEAINEHGIDRHAYVVGFGGGAFLDAVGFAATIAHRGVRMVRLPSTVLAQNDAGIGVKNGINAFAKKNFVGAFAPPAAVINDERFLATLSDRDWRAGTSEAVKVALLRDAAFFAELEDLAYPITQRDPEAMHRLIHRCAELHLQHIAGAGDPFELGSARPLDFGHWSAHKLEKLTNHGLRHGEAVAIGIALDTTYAHLAGILGEADWRRAVGILEALGFELSVEELDHPALLDGLTEFREHLGGELTITVIDAIGSQVDVHEIDARMMAAAVEELRGAIGARV
ncbi:MAG: 3-dehydroquinate synthase [Solirubrobacterales bacterium]